MIYELREYKAAPGKLSALIERFNKSALDLFRKHHMSVVFIGRTTIGNDSSNELVYMLSFESYQDLNDKWNRFLNDPEWQDAKAKSELNGPLVWNVQRRLLDPTDLQISLGPSD